MGVGKEEWKSAGIKIRSGYLTLALSWLKNGQWLHNSSLLGGSRNKGKKYEHELPLKPTSQKKSNLRMKKSVGRVLFFCVTCALEKNVTHALFFGVACM